MINNMMLGFALDRTRHSGRAEAWRGARSALFPYRKISSSAYFACVQNVL